jgi:hypothetical protein
MNAFFIRLLRWVTLSFLWLGASAMAQEDFQMAARQDLPGMLSKIPAGQSALYGFPGMFNVAYVELGRPWRLVHPSSASADSVAAGLTLQEQFVETGLYVFPVLYDGRACCVLLVDRTATGWRGVSLGRARLAQAMEPYRAGQPEVLRQLIEIPQLRACLIPSVVHTDQLVQLAIVPGQAEQITDWRAVCARLADWRMAQAEAKP